MIVTHKFGKEEIALDGTDILTQIRHHHQKIIAQTGHHIVSVSLSLDEFIRLKEALPSSPMLSLVEIYGIPIEFTESHRQTDASLTKEEKRYPDGVEVRDENGALLGWLDVKWYRGVAYYDHAIIGMVERVNLWDPIVPLSIERIRLAVRHWRDKSGNVWQCLCVKLEQALTMDWEVRIVRRPIRARRLFRNAVYAAKCRIYGSGGVYPHDDKLIYRAAHREDSRRHAMLGHAMGCVKGDDSAITWDSAAMAKQPRRALPLLD